MTLKQTNLILPVNYNFGSNWAYHDGITTKITRTVFKPPNLIAIETPKVEKWIIPVAN